jgi:hypothetical protein
MWRHFRLVLNLQRMFEKSQAVAQAARTGIIGDGKEFVVLIEEAVRIRTRERGLAALQSGSSATFYLADPGSSVAGSIASF